MGADTTAHAGPEGPAFTWARFRSYVKLEHTLFSVPVLLAAAVLAAGGLPPWDRVLVTLVAAAGARTAGMSLNRIVDRRLDALNPRTAARELPAGRISLPQAWIATVAALLVYEAGAFYLAPVCVALSPLPVLVFWGYPYLKRFTPLAHFGVGLALALAPLGAYLAVRPDPGPALRGAAPLALFTFFWVSGFDIIYSTMDEASDRRNGLHSMPADLGARRALAVSAALHALAFAALGWLTFTRLHGPVAWVALAGCGALLLLEHRNATDVNLAFFKFNAWLSFAVLALVLAGVFLG
ncbi:MAG: UbiA family prenyltransferase [Candidatus Eisenbacteria bacterium]|nr:UbiA family prenyltransferase [Candidatus Eisenbacteria bacterium]